MSRASFVFFSFFSVLATSCTAVDPVVNILSSSQNPSRSLSQPGSLSEVQGGSASFESTLNGYQARVEFDFNTPDQAELQSPNGYRLVEFSVGPEEEGSP